MTNSIKLLDGKVEDKQEVIDNMYSDDYFLPSLLCTLPEILSLTLGVHGQLKRSQTAQIRDARSFG